MIDDNPEDLESWSKGLAESSSQYSILKAGTVKESLNCCQYHKVGCVVLDLDMDDSSGFEVLLSLIPNPKGPQIAVVVLTRLKIPRCMRRCCIMVLKHVWSSNAHQRWT